MSSDPVDRIAAALLYEGYMLYPYRPSSVKNRQRFNFGVIYPEAYSQLQSGVEPCAMQTEFIVLGTAETSVEVRARFLQLVVRTSGTQEPAWQEAVEREVAVPVHSVGELLAGMIRLPFVFPAAEKNEGGISRRHVRLEGEIEVSARHDGEGTFVVTARLVNLTEWSAPPGGTREDALPNALVSAHFILRVGRGELVSLLDPPESLRVVAARCRNIGGWPVLVGEEGSRDTALFSPIIIYDYPRIAPESAGDLFDATEIDEILSLRIMTLTDEEKAEIRRSDERARVLLERTESLAAEQMMSLHGTMRPVRSSEGS